MRGGAQSQLMLGSDGKLWVVKFQNNPQHLRVLANELVATRLAEALGLTVPKTDVIEVSEWLIRNTPGMVLERGREGNMPCAAGLQFGSQFVGGLMPGQVVDYLPDQQMLELRNLHEFAGMLLIDKWTGNCNGRQAVYERKTREKRYRAVFVDQGYCFNAGAWTFPDAPLRGIFARNLVYRQVTGWESFEPWLTRLEAFPEEKLWAIAETVPPEWYGGNLSEMEALIQQLILRRTKVRDQIRAFRESSREPFPQWERKQREVGARIFEIESEASKFVM
ncbi:MAG: phosphatidylinositol kinase [Acidobacteriaceae bacterium]|nr:phosphatidylinositol kinase [Acidobacteriaceae bacterium]